jgi:hypothetical protein
VIAWIAVDVPYWDEWEWADLIYKMHVGTLQFADLWAQHNENRILVPNLIMLGLDRFGGWSPIREQFVSLFFIICTQIGLLTIIRRTMRGVTSSLAAVFASMMLYGLWQVENLDWGFQLLWFLCNAACVAIVALLTYRGRGALHTCAAIVLAIVASFSASQGLIIWVCGAAAILLTPRRITGTLLLWLGAAAATFVVYFRGMNVVDAGHVSLFAHPLTALRYALAYLGSPLGGSHGVVASMIAGAIVTAVVLACAITDLVRPQRFRHLVRRGPWYALAVFPLASAVATTVGRAGFGLEQALSSRYTTLSGLLWVAAFCLVASYARPHLVATAPRRLFAAGAACGMLALLAIASSWAGWQTWQADAAARVAARSSISRGDPALLHVLYPDVSRIEDLIEKLRRVHDGPFKNG